MASGRDEDGLSWDGDDDPTLEVGPAPEQTRGAMPGLPKGYSAVGRGSEGFPSDDAERAPADEPASTPDATAHHEIDRPAMGNGELITLGVLGGVYALFAIGWLIGGLRLQGWRPFLVTDAMYQGSLWLAALAPVLWFVTVFLLTRTARVWVRFAWLAAGVVLLVPWPFVLIGAVGQ
ncbi:DNA polymerase III subunit gamma/tau [Microbacterium allomyrinae]|uniref:DNA polymerase III subunit gamma/tau n=1 Tax=Microbacterium allomyrinae TaxID=2830666 RepID=A0A9X1LUU6_9MICO|nr:DNA polymerase III subunit gamma/tau [Microbacterium allomyrinae]MCC2032425.1 DNA polymerase III subunit gamma/tau [Microbacterium allomyrinae]